MKKDKVLVLGGSIRTRREHRNIVLNLAAEAVDIQSYIQGAREVLDGGTKLANSEILAGAALAGARHSGVDVDYFPLRQLFPAKDCKAFTLRGGDAADTEYSYDDTLSINEKAFGELMERLSVSRGIVLSTPVYFGDRSSVANKFIQMASELDRVNDKVCGVVSVGAKRNGGQETCDIYSLFEMMNYGALGVGNGLPTSQYGGTAVGGDMGAVLDDDWGLQTAHGTGSRVAQISRLMNGGLSVNGELPCKIALVVSMDTKDRQLRAYVETLVEKAAALMPNVEFTIVSLVDNDIFRCLGCDVCPRGKETEAPHCVIRDPEDYLEGVCRQFVEMDGIVVCGFNPQKLSDIVTRYQVFTERMRYVRRSDYALSNKLFAGLCYHQFGATINPIHSLKVMTSYIRHNTVFHKPIEVFDHGGTILSSGMDELLSFCRSAALLKEGANHVALPSTPYNPYGEGGGYGK